MIVSYGSTTPRERGAMDSYYRRPPDPHKYDETGRVRITDLTPDETADYLKGYEDNDDFKDWG